MAVGLPQTRTLAVLDGQGHEATDTAPDLLASRLAWFFSYCTVSARCGSFQPGRTKWHVYPFGYRSR